MNDSARIMSALEELGAAGAQGLPEPYEVLKAAAHKVWSGEKKDGGHWMLTKNSQDSYTVVF